MAARRFPVRRVSSHRIRSHEASNVRARALMSPRLPIGVETSTRPFGGADWPSRESSGDVADAATGIPSPYLHPDGFRLRWANLRPIRSGETIWIERPK